MNGWRNHETWNFIQWHGDDIESHVEQYVDHFATLDEDELADEIETFAYGLVGLDSLPIGFARDAAATTFHNINWREIARANQSIIDAATTNDDEE
jgi:hypothetical protein